MEFKDMMNRAKMGDLNRDKKRSHKADKNKRYETLAFPAYHGSPIRTEWFILAWIIAIYRMFNYAEVRIINHETKKHWVY